MQVGRTMVDGSVRRGTGWWGFNPGIRTGRRPIHLRFPSYLWVLGLGAKHAQVLTRVLGVGLRSTRRSMTSCRGQLRRSWAGWVGICRFGVTKDTRGR